MIRINLLPHREQKRAARQRQFAVLAGLVVGLAVVVSVLVHTVLSSRIDNQKSRNAFLQSEIVKLDKEIEEIKVLKEQTQALLARKKVVETLQGNRAQVVHLMDQLVRQLPDGVYLKAVKQTGDRINLQGYAQSNARVASLMRNLEASPWLVSPDLVETKAATINNLRVSEFSLNVRLTLPQQPDGADDKDSAAKKAKDKKA